MNGPTPDMWDFLTLFAIGIGVGLFLAWVF